MNGVTVLEQHEVNNLAELVIVLERMSLNALHQIDDSTVCINDSPASVRLEVQKLTDGSEVYNIAIESKELLTRQLEREDAAWLNDTL